MRMLCLRSFVLLEVFAVVAAASSAVGSHSSSAPSASLAGHGQHGWHGQHDQHGENHEKIPWSQWSPNSSDRSSQRKDRNHYEERSLRPLRSLQMKNPALDYYCGLSWPDASASCPLPCPKGRDDECAELGEGYSCYFFTGCFDKVGAVGDSPSDTPDSTDSPDSPVSDAGDAGDAGGGGEEGDGGSGVGNGNGASQVEDDGQDAQVDESDVADETDVAESEMNEVENTESAESTVTREPTNEPTIRPTNYPTNHPTIKPMIQSTNEPTNTPTNQPTNKPTTRPPIQRRTKPPTKSPTATPIKLPTKTPTKMPTRAPTDSPMVMALQSMTTGSQSDLKGKLGEEIKSSYGFVFHIRTPDPSRAAAINDNGENSANGGGSAASGFGSSGSAASGFGSFGSSGSAASGFGSSSGGTNAGENEEPLGGRAILITGMEFYTISKYNVTYELWSRPGPYKGSQSYGGSNGSLENHLGSYEGWELIASGTVKGRGYGEYTPIPGERFTPVGINGGGGDQGTRAFYLTLTTLNLVSKVGVGGADGGGGEGGAGGENNEVVHHSNDDLEIYEGEGVLVYPFPDPSQTHFYRSPRQFLGTIHYDRQPCKPFSDYGLVQTLPCPALPTVSPTIPPPTASPTTAAPTDTPTADPTIAPTSSAPPTPSPILGQTSSPTSPTSSPTFSPTFKPTYPQVLSLNLSPPTQSPVSEITANIVMVLRNVPARLMTEQEGLVFGSVIETFLEEINVNGELQGIEGMEELEVEGVEIWHQHWMEVDADNADYGDSVVGVVDAAVVKSVRETKERTSKTNTLRQTRRSSIRKTEADSEVPTVNSLEITFILRLSNVGNLNGTDDIGNKISAIFEEKDATLLQLFYDDAFQSLGYRYFSKIDEIQTYAVDQLDRVAPPQNSPGGRPTTSDELNKSKDSQSGSEVPLGDTEEGSSGASFGLLVGIGVAIGLLSSLVGAAWVYLRKKRMRQMQGKDEKGGQDGKNSRQETKVIALEGEKDGVKGISSSTIPVGCDDGSGSKGMDAAEDLEAVKDLEAVDAVDDLEDGPDGSSVKSEENKERNNEKITEGNDPESPETSPSSDEITKEDRKNATNDDMAKSEQIRRPSGNRRPAAGKRRHMSVVVTGSETPFDKLKAPREFSQSAPSFIREHDDAQTLSSVSDSSSSGSSDSSDSSDSDDDVIITKKVGTSKVTKTKRRSSMSDFAANTEEPSRGKPKARKNQGLSRSVVVSSSKEQSKLEEKLQRKLEAQQKRRASAPDLTSSDGDIIGMFDAKSKARKNIGLSQSVVVSSSKEAVSKMGPLSLDDKLKKKMEGKKKRNSAPDFASSDIESLDEKLKKKLDGKKKRNSAPDIVSSDVEPLDDKLKKKMDGKKKRNSTPDFASSDVETRSLDDKLKQKLEAKKKRNSDPDSVSVEGSDSKPTKTAKPKSRKNRGFSQSVVVTSRENHDMLQQKSRRGSAPDSASNDLSGPSNYIENSESAGKNNPKTEKLKPRKNRKLSQSVIVGSIKAENQVMVQNKSHRESAPDSASTDLGGPSNGIESAERPSKNIQKIDKLKPKRTRKLSQSVIVGSTKDQPNFLSLSKEKDDGIAAGIATSYQPKSRRKSRSMAQSIVIESSKDQSSKFGDKDFGEKKATPRRPALNKQLSRSLIVTNRENQNMLKSAMMLPNSFKDDKKEENRLSRSLHHNSYMDEEKGGVRRTPPRDNNRPKKSSLNNSFNSRERRGSKDLLNRSLPELEDGQRMDKPKRKGNADLSVSCTELDGSLKVSRHRKQRSKDFLDRSFPEQEKPKRGSKDLLNDSLTKIDDSDRKVNKIKRRGSNEYLADSLSDLDGNRKAGKAKRRGSKSAMNDSFADLDSSRKAGKSKRRGSKIS